MKALLLLALLLASPALASEYTISGGAGGGGGGTGDIDQVGDCGGPGACFTGVSGGMLTGPNGDMIDLGATTNDTLIFKTDGVGTSTVIITGRDAVTPNNTTYTTTGAGAITIGGAAVTAVTVTAGGGSGNTSFVVPNDSISAAEILQGTSGQVLMSNATPDTTWTTISGDITIGATGAVVIGPDKVLVTMINQGTAGQVLMSNATPTTTWTTLAGEVTVDSSGNTTVSSGAVDFSELTGAATNAQTTATSLNVPSTIVSRNASGNFAAGTITATLAGNASTATAFDHNPANCLTPGDAPAGIDATGAVEGCFTPAGGGGGGTVNNVGDCNGPDCFTSAHEGGVLTGPNDETIDLGAAINDTFIFKVSGGAAAVFQGADTTTPTVANTLYTTTGAGTVTLGGGGSENVVISTNGSPGGDGELSLPNASVGPAELSPGTSAQVLLSNATPTATWTSFTGDVTVSSTGVTTVVSGQVNFNELAGSATNAQTTATSANTASAIVARDASGNFAAGTITAALAGNATTATTASTGDSATAFFTSGQIEAARGGTNIDTSASTGIAVVNSGTWSVVDGTAATMGSAISSETGTGGLVFATSPTIATPTFTTSITTPLIYGGTAAGSDLTLKGTSNGSPSGAHILLDSEETEIWPSLSGTTQTASRDLIHLNVNWTMGSGGQSFTFTEFNSNVNMNALSPVVYLHNIEGSFGTSGLTDVSGLPYQLVGFRTGWSLINNADGSWIRYQDAFTDNTTVAYDGTSDLTNTTQNQWAPISFVSQGSFKTLGAGDYSFNTIFGALAHPTFQTASASSILHVNEYSGFHAAGPTVVDEVGIVDFDTYAGLHVDWDLFASSLADTGSLVDNAYGVLIDSLAPASLGTVTKAWSFYSSQTGNALSQRGKTMLGGPASTLPTHTLEVGGSQGSVGGGATNIITAGNPSFAITGAGNSAWIYSDGTITHGSAAAAAPSSWSAFHNAEVNNTNSTTSSTLATVYTFWDGGTISTSVNNGPNDVSSFISTPTISATTTRAATGTTVEGLRVQPAVRADAAGVSFSIAEIYGFIFQPAVTSVSGQTTKITDVYGNYTANITNSGAGNVGVAYADQMFGLYIEGLTNATKSAGVFNSDATVFNPGTTVTAGGTFTIDPKHHTTIRLVSTGSVTSNTGDGASGAIADGDYDGQILTIINSDPEGADKKTFKNGANTDLGADCVLNPGGTLVVQWDASTAVNSWVKISCSPNQAGTECGMLNSNMTQAVTSSTSETTFFTYTLPALLLSSVGDTIEFDAAGTTLNNADTKTIRVKFGATTILSFTPTASQVNEWQVNGVCTRTGSSAQKCWAHYSNGGATNTQSTDYTAPGELLSGTVTFLVTGQSSTATASNVTGEMFRIRWCQATA